MNTQLPARMVSESKPVRVLGTVLAVLVGVQGYIATINGVPDWVKLVLGGVILVTTVGLAKWTENRVTPWEDVAAKETPSGAIVAGPAASQPNGTAVVISSAAGPATPTHGENGDLL